MISAIALANKYYKKINKETHEDFIRLRDFRHNSMDDFINCYLPYHSHVVNLLHYMSEEFYEKFEKLRTVLSSNKIPINKLNSYQRDLKAFNTIRYCFGYCAMIRFCIDNAINLQIMDVNKQACPKIKLDNWKTLEGNFAVSLTTKGFDTMFIGLICCTDIFVNIFFLEIDKGVSTMPVEFCIDKNTDTVKVKYFYDTGDTFAGYITFTVESLCVLDNNMAEMQLSYSTEDYAKYLKDAQGNNDSIDKIMADPVLTAAAKLLLSCQYAISEYVFYSTACRREATVTSHSAGERKKHEGHEVQIITPQEEFKYVPISSLANKIYYGHREWQGGTHASPYAHYRSGHQRRLKDGRIINVRSSAVGGTPEQKEAIAIAAATGKPIPFYGKTKKIYVADYTEDCKA